MGWLWSSFREPSSLPELPSNSDSFEPPISTTTAPEPATSKPPTQNQVAQVATEHPFSSPQNPSSQLEPSTSSSPLSSPTTIPPANPHLPAREPLTPAHTLPTSVSCRSIFDRAWHCQSIGGQFQNIYRYGHLRKCSPLWSDFWWCMRTNRGRMSDEARRERVMQRYAEKERALRAGRSSEDVWEERTWLVGKAWEPMPEGGMVEREERGKEGREERRGAMRGLYTS